MLSEIVKEVRGKDGEEPNNPPRQRGHQKREEGGGWGEAHDPPRQRGHQKRGSGGREWLTMKLMVLRFESPEGERRSFMLTTQVLFLFFFDSNFILCLSGTNLSPHPKVCRQQKPLPGPAP